MKVFIIIYYLIQIVIYYLKLINLSGGFFKVSSSLTSLMGR